MEPAPSDHDAPQNVKYGSRLSLNSSNVEVLHGVLAGIQRCFSVMWVNTLSKLYSNILQAACIRQSSPRPFFYITYLLLAVCHISF